MPNAKNTVVIARPVEEVFAFLSDCENDPKWRPAVLSIRREGAYGKGAVYRQMVKGPFGRALTSDFMVTAFDENRGFAFSVISGPVRPHGSWTFSAVPGGTEVGLELGAELGGLKGLLLGGSVQKSMNSEVAGLERAKRVIEAG
ncbi:MAG TPA: SRPBCC family protein [Dermatophilaceae bacterium]|nr:SRPBCC family protein [Dermatophilaceae bacterium]